MIRHVIMHTPIVIDLSLSVFLWGVCVGAACIWRSGSLDWAAFASLGLLVGMVIGLSKSPVVAGAIAGALSLVTTLVPRFIDRTESGRPVGPWLLPLSVCAVLGLLAGIVIRTNDLLTFKQVHYPRLFEQLSFNRSTPTELQFGQISFNFRSNQWGYVDPNFISSFLDDLPKTEQLVPANLFYQIVNRHRLLHIVNPVFRYRVVIPEIYRLDERYNQRAGIYEAQYSDPTTGTSTHIYIKQIGYLQQWELIPALDTEAVSFMRQHLGLHLVPSPYMIQSPTDVYLGPLSDAQPRLGVVPGTVKFWRQYFKHPMEDTGYFVMYGINQHLFFTVFMQYRPSQTRGMLSAYFVERLFIASTVSFVNE